MASFKNKETGVILTTTNEEVIAQLKKNPDYVSCKAPKAAKAAAGPEDDTAGEAAEE